MKTLLPIMILGLCLQCVQAQDLERLAGDRTIKHSGSLSAQTQFYTTTGVDSRATSHWSLAGRYTLQMGDMRFPFSFSLREVGGSVSHPFNWVGMSPYYKWVKLHLGRRNLYFSPYTLAGKTINGVGVELTPGKLRLGAIYGTIRNYRVPDFDDDRAAIVDLSQRKALGAKVGFGSKANFFDLSLFKGIDDVASLEPDALAQDNLALGAKLQLTLRKRLTLQANVGASGLTENRESVAIDISPDLELAEKGLDINATSRLNFAGDASLNYRSRDFSFGLKYRRIDPLFQSLGTPFFLTDIESLTLNSSLSLLKNKWRISWTAGVEQNNLKETRINDRRRIIASLHTSITASDQLHISGSYSNFQIDAQPTLQSFDDTLRYVSVSQSSMVSLRYTFLENDGLDHSLIVSANRQTIDDQSPIANLGSDVTNLGGSLRYQLSIKEIGLRVAPGLRYTSFDNGLNQRTRYGATLRIGKSLFDKKLVTTTSLIYSYSDLNNLRNGNILRGYSILRYQLPRFGALMLRLSYTRRDLIVRESFSEFRGALGYTISL